MKIHIYEKEKVFVSAATGSHSMASLPHLESGEIALLNLAGDDSRDVLSLSDKETLILQLYNQIQEQELEKALLVQGTRFPGRLQQHYFRAHGFSLINDI